MSYMSFYFSQQTMILYCVQYLTAKFMQKTYKNQKLKLFIFYFSFYPDCCVKIIYNIRFSISKQYKLGMGYLFLTSGNLFSLLIFVRKFIQIYVSNSYCNHLEKYIVLYRKEYFYLYVDLLFHFTFHINKGTNYLLMFELCTFISYFPCVS